MQTSFQHSANETDSKNWLICKYSLVYHHLHQLNSLDLISALQSLNYLLHSDETEPCLSGFNPAFLMLLSLLFFASFSLFVNGMTICLHYIFWVFVCPFGLSASFNKKKCTSLTGVKKISDVQIICKYDIYNKILQDAHLGWA